MEKQECVLVKQPEWWNDESGNSSGFCALDQCSPGQRNAASRFFDFLDVHLSGPGFEKQSSTSKLVQAQGQELGFALMWTLSFEVNVVMQRGSSTSSRRNHFFMKGFGSSQ